MIAPDVRLGSNVTIYHPELVNLYGCEIGAECKIGTSVEIRTRVRSGASIGANATILCGITIGEHALIGAGAVVTQISGADQERVAAALRVACV